MKEDKEKTEPIKEVSLELEKATSHIVVELVEYLPNAVVIKTILKKSTGEIKVFSFDSHEGLAKKTSPFDSFVQIIDGKAEIIIDDKSTVLNKGDGIIIPAHQSHCFKANGQFKMILTVIKSGYESF